MRKAEIRRTVDRQRLQTYVIPIFNHNKEVRWFLAKRHTVNFSHFLCRLRKNSGYPIVLLGLTFNTVFGEVS